MVDITWSGSVIKLPTTLSVYEVVAFEKRGFQLTTKAK
jgi:hypothetical protein